MELFFVPWYKILRTERGWTLISFTFVKLTNRTVFFLTACLFVSVFVKGMIVFELFHLTSSALDQGNTNKANASWPSNGLHLINTIMSSDKRWRLKPVSYNHLPFPPNSYTHMHLIQCGPWVYWLSCTGWHTGPHWAGSCWDVLFLAGIAAMVGWITPCLNWFRVSLRENPAVVAAQDKDISCTGEKDFKLVSTVNILKIKAETLI